MTVGNGGRIRGEGRGNRGGVGGKGDVTPQKYPGIFIIKFIIYSGYNWANWVFFWEFLDEY